MLALATLAVYWPATRCDFIDFDDPDYVTANPQVQSGLNRESVEWAFRNPVSGNWHPVTMLSHMLDCQLFGLNPWGPHLINVLLHSLNAALVFLLLNRMMGLRRDDLQQARDLPSRQVNKSGNAAMAATAPQAGATWRSLLVAALFAVHPLHVESVAWISERKDVLSGFFGLLALIFYVRYAQCVTRDRCQVTGSGMAVPASVLSRVTGHPSLFYGLALFFFVLGLMSKPMLVTWPFVLLLLDYHPLERFKPGNAWRLAREKIPFLILAVVASAVALVVQKQEGAVMSVVNLSLGARGANALISYCRYLGKLFWPTKLAVFYPLPGHWPVEKVLLAGGLILGLSMLFWAQRRHRPVLLMGWLWYVGTLVPVSGLVQVGEQAMADRYMYLPSIGLLILIVWGGHELTKNWPQRGMILSGFSAGAMILCIVVTRQQLGYWRNSEALFQHALAVTENNPVAHNQLGTAFFNQGKMDEAINHYQEAIRLQPSYADPYYNLGNALVNDGQTAEAISQFREYIHLNPNDAVAHYNLATALYNVGQMDEAIGQYQEAIHLEPDYADAHNNLGIALGRTGQMDEAIKQFREVIRLRPDFAEVHNNLGIALLNKGQMDEGIDQFQQAIHMNPRNASAYNNLGIAFDREGRTDEAISQYQQAIRLAPGYAEAYINLGADFAAGQRFDEAIANYRQAIQIDPGRPDIYFHLGMALGQSGRIREAVAQYREAVRLNPNLTLALNNLAWALATSPDDQLRNGPEAVRLAEHACELTQYGNPLLLGTLAAAYAEAGRFPEAVTMAEKAEQLAITAGAKKLAGQERQLLELYRASKPYHESQPTKP
jgi:tetratricopeptide (TPR) repeat protein